MTELDYGCRKCRDTGYWWHEPTKTLLPCDQHKEEKNKKGYWKKKYAKGWVPKQSYRYGHEDEGISDNLGKSLNFRYSERFLAWWYTEMGTGVKP